MHVCLIAFHIDLDHWLVWLIVFEMHLNSVYIICDLLIAFQIQLFMLNVIFFKVFETFLNENCKIEMFLVKKI